MSNGVNVLHTTNLRVELLASAYSHIVNEGISDNLQCLKGAEQQMKKDTRNLKTDAKLEDGRKT